MKTRYQSYIAAVVAAMTLGVSSCIEEIDPQTSTVTEKQAADAPGFFESSVASLTSNLCGQFTYSGSDQRPYDFGYPSFFLQRDAMGQDMVTAGTNNWFSVWYEASYGLGPTYAYCQVPWTYYYKWIDNCNKVIAMYKQAPEGRDAGAGIAYALRAMFYQDIARMFCAKPFVLDPNAETVPLVLDDSEIGSNNPRVPFTAAYEQIISDLNTAEELLANYEREDIYTPDLSVVYGLKARAYLEIQDWANAEKYAKMAQQGYRMMTEAEYTSRDYGFNTPNDAWMFGVVYKKTDPNIKDNDGDSSWGSIMIMENAFDCGYAANYGGPMLIDRHLYETIPASDWRKKVFVDFALNDLDEDGQQEGLAAYTAHPAQIMNSVSTAQVAPGGMEFKFRPAAGKYAEKYDAWCVSVPLMRVEEMYLIEAEAAGMQDANRGQQLLTAFAKTRDAEYEYGKHQDAYGNSTTSAFQNEVWWQRRVELWGEGFATFDVKRLNKAVIRNYEGTNHIEGYRWNFENQLDNVLYPNWMNLCIVQTETNYNYGCTQNPAPNAPSKDSEIYSWK
jgi:SusD family.